MCGVGRRSDFEILTLTRACLAGAALLPWFAVFSGTYGLYFYILLVAVMLAQWLLIPLLVLAAPLAVLLLLLMPAGAVYAAMGHRLGGWAGRLIRCGCVVSMMFAVAYGGLTAVIRVAPVFADGAAETLDLSLSWRMGGLIIGFLTTWRAWRWLRGIPHHK